MQLRFFASVLLVCSATAMEDKPKQPTMGYRSAPLLTVDGLTFKDLNRNGKLDPYEDWRLPAEVRTADLVQRMSLEELAGVMVHGTLPSAGPLVPLGVGKEYDPTGFVVVADPAQADLAIIRAPAPYESEHPNFFFGSRQHEGRLAFTEKDAAYAELLRVSPLVPTVFLTTLERPLILTNIRLHATALLGLRHLRPSAAGLNHR